MYLDVIDILDPENQSEPEKQNEVQKLIQILNN